MAAQLLAHTVPCRASFSPASCSGRQSPAGFCPSAPPCKLGRPFGCFDISLGRSYLVARRPLKAVELSPGLQQCFGQTRRRRRSCQSHAAQSTSGAGCLDHNQANGSALSALSIPTTAMAKRGLGSSGGAAVLERKKLDLTQKTRSPSAPKLDNSGGAGGIGKILHNGGGGDDDGGDDDDYFSPGDEGGDDGDGFFKGTLRELYDQESIKAVLQEWGRTFQDIPLMIRQSAEFGLFSSAQLVRFLSMDVRPSLTRSATRAVPTQISRGFVGRLMADPAFTQKLMLEGLFAVGTSVAWEYRQRGDRFLNELDLVAVNTLSLAAASGAMVWLMAPNRSMGALHKSSWQNTLHSLPGNVFDKSTPVKQLSMGSRTGSFFWKSAELAMVGALSGLSMTLFGDLAVRARRMRNPNFQQSVDMPSAARSTGGMALSMGAFSNVRYQAISGIDRMLSERINFMWVYLLLSASFRFASQLIGQPTRLYLQGLPTKVPDHKLAQRQRQRDAKFASAQAQLEAHYQQQQAAAAKPKRRTAPAGSSGFEMSTRQHRQPQPSMALASATQ